MTTHVWALLIAEGKLLDEAAHDSSLGEVVGWQVLEEVEKGVNFLQADRP